MGGGESGRGRRVGVSGQGLVRTGLLLWVWLARAPATSFRARVRDPGASHGSSHGASRRESEGAPSRRRAPIQGPARADIRDRELLRPERGNRAGGSASAPIPRLGGSCGSAESCRAPAGGCALCAARARGGREA